MCNRDKFCCREFKVIIMDCDMPVKDGYTATKEIRKELGYKGRIIGYTAFTRASEIYECYVSGMDFVLHKPSPPKKILKALILN